MGMDRLEHRHHVFQLGARDLCHHVPAPMHHAALPFRGGKYFRHIGDQNWAALIRGTVSSEDADGNGTRIRRSRATSSRKPSGRNPPYACAGFPEFGKTQAALFHALEKDGSGAGAPEP
jgi:hypothetical protein